MDSATVPQRRQLPRYTTKGSVLPIRVHTGVRRYLPCCSRQVAGTQASGYGYTRRVRKGDPLGMVSVLHIETSIRGTD